MQKYFFIFWDAENVPERKLYVQCENCHKENRKGYPWSTHMLHKEMEVKCDLCNTIIFNNKDKK